MNRLPKLLFVFLILAACTDQGDQSASPLVTKSIENPKPADFLSKENPDIFYWNGFVYSNGSDIEWVQNTIYQLKEEAVEITNQTKDIEGFSDRSATVLPVGTKIYQTNTSILIAILDGKEIPYIPMIEG